MTRNDRPDVPSESWDPISGDDEPEGRGLWVAYGVILVIYIGLGLAFRTVVLNWVIGPLFPLITLYLIPRVFGRDHWRGAT